MVSRAACWAWPLSAGRVKQWLLEYAFFFRPIPPGAPMKRGVVLLLGLLGLAVVAIALFVVPPRETHPVRIVSPPAIIASLPHWIAEERGLYADEGIEIRTVSFNSSRLMIEALYGKDADFLPAVSLADVALAAINRGSDQIRIISHSRMKTDPAFEAIVVPGASGIRNLGDLAGKKIGVYPGETSRGIVEYYLRSNGVDTNAVKFVPMAPPDHLQSLVRGDIDASHLYDPLRTQYLRAMSGRAVSPSIYATLNEDSAVGVTVISQRFAQENPAAARAIIRVWDKAIGIIRRDPEFSRRVLADRMKLSRDVATAATWVDATKTSELSPSHIKATLITLTRAGLLPKGKEVPPAVYAPLPK